MRPFKDIKEFNTKIHKSIGDTDAIGIGSCARYLNDMSNVYEHFDEDSVKWLPFVAINTFTNRMKELFEGIATGVEGNAVSIGECTEEVKE